MMGKVCRSFARYLATSLLACALPACAQTVKYEGRPIAGIQFVPAEQPLTTSELANAVPMKPGAPFRLADVHAAIERLYATGNYQDIQVDAEPAAPPASGVAIRIITRNSWFVGNVAAIGHVSDPPSRGQLVNVTRLDLGSLSLKRTSNLRNGPSSAYLPAMACTRAMYTPSCLMIRARSR